MNYILQTTTIVDQTIMVFLFFHCNLKTCASQNYKFITWDLLSEPIKRILTFSLQRDKVNFFLLFLQISRQMIDVASIVLFVSRFFVFARWVIFSVSIDIFAFY